MVFADDKSKSRWNCVQLHSHSRREVSKHYQSIVNSWHGEILWVISKINPYVVCCAHGVGEDVKHVSMRSLRNVVMTCWSEAIFGRWCSEWQLRYQAPVEAGMLWYHWLFSVNCAWIVARGCWKWKWMVCVRDWSYSWGISIGKCVCRCVVGRELRERNMSEREGLHVVWRDCWKGENFCHG